ncbi:acetyl esterase [Symmachiella macrocystis]|uniref:Acetyl esterase n=1 Tax=Symmachiella macrocystis TaxID=2527985 RepID=A0A5C6BMM3_9PLAN|nr:alpha/beta hydrolase [Symmachiella macrocystis]TWU13400.1 acetyl esterase [Symmachiella macrocystis]
MKKRSAFALWATCGLLVTAVAVEACGGQAKAKFTVQKGLVFARGDRELTFDLYRPQNPSGPFPCVIVIQGGGFRAQDGQRIRPIAERLAKNGFAAALISYRGRPDHEYRDTLADVRSAVRFIRTHSGEYGIAPDRIGAMGRSAGATLAVLLAVGDGVKSLEPPGGAAEGSSRIQAAAGIAGVYDFVARFTDKDQLALQPNAEKKRRTNGEWIGAEFSETNADWQQASAINHVNQADPPVLLLHSRNDRTVPWLQSRDMHARLKQVGIAAEIEISNDGGHRGPATAEQWIVIFFKKALAKKAAAPAR